MEWCFIGENSKEGITSFYVVGEEVMKKEIIKREPEHRLCRLEYCDKKIRNIHLNISYL